jgi:hypothetical protein
MKDANLRRLITWQWNVYANAHQDRRNLLIHIVGVPLFCAGAVSVLAGLAGLAWTAAALGALAMLAGFALQGFGHRYERNAPPPFSSRGEFLTRILTEQFVVFPRFFLSGAWWRGLRAASRS